MTDLEKQHRKNEATMLDAFARWEGLRWMSMSRSQLLTDTKEEFNNRTNDIKNQLDKFIEAVDKRNDADVANLIEGLHK